VVSGRQVNSRNALSRAKRAESFDECPVVDDFFLQGVGILKGRFVVGTVQHLHRKIRSGGGGDLDVCGGCCYFAESIGDGQDDREGGVAREGVEGVLDRRHASVAKIPCKSVAAVAARCARIEEDLPGGKSTARGCKRCLQGNWFGILGESRKRGEKDRRSSGSEGAKWGAWFSRFHCRFIIELHCHRWAVSDP